MFERISFTKAQELLKKPDLYLLDIRDKADYEKQHIQGAQHLARDNENLAAFATTADRKRAVLVYCYRGNSSQKIAHYLAEQGFINVFSLDGGFENWRICAHEKNGE
jgi:thiosulfate sulfurtransferase